MTVLRVGIAAGANGLVIFLKKGEKVYPRLRGTNSVTRYGLSEVSCVISNKSSYLDDETWAKMAKVVSPFVRKMKVINVDCVFPIVIAIYIHLHICTSKSY